MQIKYNNCIISIYVVPGILNALGLDIKSIFRVNLNATLNVMRRHLSIIY